jgi:diguanylate cyclase (GGDEF)-like protein
VRKFAAGNLDHRINIETGDEIEELAETFNEMAASIQRQTRALEQAAVTDQLTGLYNRRHLIEVLQLEIARCERHGGEFAVAVMDVDHFKNFNDTRGHLAGDEVLVSISETLRSSCRRIDTLARFGGEEFVVVLPNADLDHGREACQRLRYTVEHKEFPGEETQPGGTVTISIGVASYPADGTSFDQLLAVADERLYASKKAGRNRVAWGTAPDEIAATDPDPDHSVFAEQAAPASAE